MKTLCLILALLGAPDFESALLLLTGAGTLEELSEEVVERYSRLESHPVNINTASRRHLEDCGLFSRYQAASIIDYRSRSGDIISVTELGLLNGFSPAAAQALSLFVSFESGRAPAQKERHALSGSTTVRLCAKQDGKQQSAQLLKCNLQLGDKAELNWATRRSYDGSTLWPGTISIAAYGQRSKIVVGDWAARFGEGLTMWSAFSMSGFGTAASFRRSGTGIACTSSLSGSLRGIAGDFCAGPWQFSAGWAPDFSGGSHLLVGNVNRDFKNVTLGATATSEAAGISVRAGWKGKSVWAEASRQHATGGYAALCGMQWVPSYGNAVSLLARHYGSNYKVAHSGAVRTGTKCNDEAGATLGLQLYGCSLNADASVKPSDGKWRLKGIAMAGHEFTLWGTAVLKPEMRASVRYRPADSPTTRTDLRFDLTASCGKMQAAARFNTLWCIEHSWLAYTEAAFKSNALQLYGRWTLFCIDRWDDRIYAYERDAPGSFNCPAYYGRGWSLSAYAVWKPHRAHSLYLRVAYTTYPWTVPTKSSRTEVRLQYCLKLSAKPAALRSARKLAVFRAVGTRFRGGRTENGGFFGP